VLVLISSAGLIIAAFLARSDVRGNEKGLHVFRVDLFNQLKKTLSRFCVLPHAKSLTRTT
jgi:hypothetical protein